MSGQKKRILVWGLSNNRAGTEAVIAAYVKAADKEKYCFDFLCYDDPKNFAELYSLDTENRVFQLPVKIKHPIMHKKELDIFMEEHAHEYYAVWFNANDTSNIDILIAANRRGIPYRILHSHNGDIPKRPVTRLFARLNEPMVKKVVNKRWACSKAAGDFMFKGADYTIIPNMVDADRFAFGEDLRASIRSAFGWKDCFLVGTVGRLSEQKNQAFLIDLMPKLQKRIPNIKLVIIGGGELKEDLMARARKLGVENLLEILPPQKDIPAFLSAFDCFVFPSLYEGLSLSALEAQFNGLPCVVSDGVSAETKISDNTVFLGLNDTASWIDAIENAQRREDTLIKEAAQIFDARNIDSIASNMFDLD